MMKQRILHHNTEADVLGLPMYLIIVMIVAVAVIAAVIFMIPQGSRTMNAIVTENSVIAEDPGNASEFIFEQEYNVSVKVTTNDNRADPIAGATVTLLGSGVAGSGTTDDDGEVIISVTPSLNTNINEAAIRLIVKASGFEEYSDDDAVTVYRL
jgi:hypothetical protein